MDEALFRVSRPPAPCPAFSHMCVFVCPSLSAMVNINSSMRPFSSSLSKVHNSFISRWNSRLVLCLPKCRDIIMSPPIVKTLLPYSSWDTISSRRQYSITRMGDSVTTFWKTTRGEFHLPYYCLFNFGRHLEENSTFSLGTPRGYRGD